METKKTAEELATDYLDEVIPVHFTTIYYEKIEMINSFLAGYNTLLPELEQLREKYDELKATSSRQAKMLHDKDREIAILRANKWPPEPIGTTISDYKLPNK